MQIEIWRGLLTGKAATNTQWTRELTFMDSASFAATVFARQFATVFNGSFQSFLIQLYNQLPMYVFNGLWSGRGEREPVLLFYGQPFPPFKAVFIHWNLHVLLCSEQRCTFCIMDGKQNKSHKPANMQVKTYGQGFATWLLQLDKRSGSVMAQLPSENWKCFLNASNPRSDGMQMSQPQHLNRTQCK